MDLVDTIHRVAQDLGESEDWLADVANEMEIEDGAIWVYGVGEDGILAFTDFGIENLIELVKMHKDDPTLLKRYQPDDPPGGPRWMLTLFAPMPWNRFYPR